MDNMKNLKKTWLGALSFLDNNIVNCIIVVILVLYSSNIFYNINSFVGNLYNFSIIRLIVLLLIVFIAPKDVTIALLLSISYLVSLNYMINNENFESNLNYENEKFESMPAPVRDYVKRKNLSEENESFESRNSRLGGESNVSEENNRMQRVTNNSEENNETPKRNNYLKYNESFRNQVPLPVKKQCPPEMVLDGDGNCVDRNTVVENFFPMNNTLEDSSFNINIRNRNKIVTEAKNVNASSTLNEEVCLKNYRPNFESVGDVCSPTATFKDEFNAQGLNFPEGFNSPDIGSPLM
jgi:hypothetical protein